MTDSDNFSNAPFLFRSYDHYDPDRKSKVLNPGSASTLEIIIPAQATSAAPGYFKEVLINGHRYMDGAITANNRARIAWSEVLQMTSKEKNYVMKNEDLSASQAIGCLVSVGTGQSPWQIFSRKGAPAPEKYLHMYRTQSKIITSTVCERLSQHTSSHMLRHL